MYSLASGPPPDEMGLAAGGKIKQKIYPDPYGISTWDIESPRISAGPYRQ